jgi:D-threonine aldolase
MAQTWYEFDAVELVDTPALIFYPGRVKENIAIAKNIIGDVSRLRPHVKTHKSVQVTRLMLKAGITKYKCATIAEAEMLAISGAPDVLMAYQPVLTKMKRLIQLIKKYPRTQFACLIDNAASAQMIAEEAKKENLNINVFIDVNIGMNRTGILPAGVMALYHQCNELLEGIYIKGLHAYDGHIYEPDLTKRKAECLEAFEPVAKLITEIEAEGYAKPVIVAGGTPTFPIFAQMPEVECSPGTFALWDEQYQKLFPDLPFLPAALVLTRVVSVLNEYTLCLDMGHKAIAAENDLAHRVVFLNAPGVEFVGHSEEHLVIKAPNPHHFKIGDVLYGLPVHVCPTCALYNTALAVAGGQLQDEWEIIARARQITV